MAAPGFRTSKGRNTIRTPDPAPSMPYRSKIAVPAQGEIMTEAQRTIRRSDYSPPDWRIETVDLVFDLAPEGTRVTSRLALAAAAGRAGADLVLDGEQLELVRVAIDGRELAQDAYSVDATSLTIPAPPERFSLEIETLIHPAANTKLTGLYQSNGVFCTQCEAEGFRRITYFPDRPDVMSVFRTTIRADRTRLSRAAVERQPGGRGRARRRTALRRVARPLPQAVLPVRAGRGRPRATAPTNSPPARDARSSCASMSSTARRAARNTPWIR